MISKIRFSCKLFNATWFVKNADVIIGALRAYHALLNGWIKCFITQLIKQQSEHKQHKLLNIISRLSHFTGVHDPYDSYGPWNNGSLVVQFVNCTSLERLRVHTRVHDPNDLCESYGSWNNGSRVVQLVNCISLERLRAHTRVQDPYDSCDSYGSWNNGLRVVQLVICI